MKEKSKSSLIHDVQSENRMALGTLVREWAVSKKSAIVEISASSRFTYRVYVHRVEVPI